MTKKSEKVFLKAGTELEYIGYGSFSAAVAKVLRKLQGLPPESPLRIGGRIRTMDDGYYDVSGFRVVDS